jgi:hypothetical protein
MQHRTSAARVAFLFVVAALVVQAAPAWAMPAPGSKARAGHLIAAASRHSLERHSGRNARLGAPSASDFAPGGHAAFLVERANERPLELLALALARGTGFTPATAPTAVRRLRE